eukprot:g4214.t1
MVAGAAYLSALSSCYKALSMVLIPAIVAFQGIVKLLGQKIQTHSRAEPVPGPKAWNELGETLLCFFVVANIAAWPAKAGWPAVSWKLGADGTSLAASAAQVVGVMLAADAYTYWKHRLLHTRALYAYHKSHHVFADPSCFAAFAQHPVEGILTFWPIVLFGVRLPGFTVCGPLHMPTLAGFVCLNLYLHCGYSMRSFDRLLTGLLLDTSALHNRHHETSRSNFGEVLVLWDKLMGTCDDHNLAGAQTQAARKAA